MGNGGDNITSLLLLHSSVTWQFLQMVAFCQCIFMVIVYNIYIAVMPRGLKQVAA